MGNTDKTAAASKDSYNATVIQRVNITPRLSIFRIRPDEDFKFSAGQFTVLGLTHAAPRLPDADAEEPDPTRQARLIRRAYSISSGSQEQEFVEFFISLIGSGQLTPRLFCLKVGDRLFMGTKATGVFTLDRVASDKQLLLIGTGTGLAPYMSMVRTLALGEGCPVRPMVVLHGARYSWDLGYRAELESLGRACGGFRYLPVITRPQDDPSWNGLTGRLDRILDLPELSKQIGFSLNPQSCHVFLCGNPEMVEGVATLLQGRGFDPGSRKEPGNLHMEKYW
ncbi:MAG: ferredoxin--NADP reductase [Magnetococcales bacterium]|nr:ferredoxin--NADP reductase [Magnetococcales bacterium]MBF0174974.1 ferredoxin--NADP reductase [Magnetococcales bacterium]MBF0632832.1 ferredoxin--NADP reductase [Magnetococcales bacterium]